METWLRRPLGLGVADRFRLWNRDIRETRESGKSVEAKEQRAFTWFGGTEKMSGGDLAEEHTEREEMGERGRREDRSRRKWIEDIEELVRRRNLRL